MSKTAQELQADAAAFAVTNKFIFHKALLSLHKDIEVLKKDETNPFFKSKYVPLPTMLKVLKPVINKHGFILDQSSDLGNHTAALKNIATSRIIHAETGLSSESRIVLPDFQKMQDLGGAMTYARRYTLSALLSLEEIDDDGNAVSGNKVKKPSVQSKDKF